MVSATLALYLHAWSYYQAERYLLLKGSHAALDSICSPSNGRGVILALLSRTLARSDRAYLGQLTAIA